MARKQQKQRVVPPVESDTGLLGYTTIIQDNMQDLWDLAHDHQSSNGAGGSGTVNSGTTPRVAYYATSGTAVSDTTAFTVGSNGPNGVIVGTNTNDSAAAGIVGEVIRAEVQRGSEVSLTTATTINLVSISLTPGHWNIVGSIGFDYATSTSNSANRYSISTTSLTHTNANTTLSTPATNGEQRGEHDYTAVVHGNTVKNYPPLISPAYVATTTTYYFVVDSVFTVSTAATFGSLIATRVR